MVCNFYDSDSGFGLEEQTKNYLLGIITPAGCAVQQGQVTLQILSGDVLDFQADLCSGFELQIGFESGNQLFYTYQVDDQEVELVVYVISLT